MDTPPLQQPRLAPPSNTTTTTTTTTTKDEIQPAWSNVEMSSLCISQDQTHEHNQNIMGQENNNPTSPSLPPPIIPRTLAPSLYTSHFLSTWNSRLFEFASILFLSSIYQSTLRPMSIYALVRSASAILFSPAFGKWIDRGDRLAVVRASIVGQRVAVAGSCAVFWVLVSRRGEVGGRERMVRDGLFGVAVVLACVEKVCAVMNLVAVERDWIVVITQDNENARRIMNARMRRIDLFCKLVGPLVISLINGASVMIAIWATLGMSLSSVLIEYVCIARVYKMVPGLKRAPTPSPALALTPMEHTDTPGRTNSRLVSRMISIASAILPINSLPFYFHHPALIPSFSLSLLYLTVLSFSGPMITFLLFSGYTSLHVGIARTVSTIFELSATWIAPRLSKRIGGVRASLWFLNCEMLWLTGGVCWYLARYYRDPRETMVVTASGLVAAVALSRVGLWGFDLCAQGIVQNHVDFNHRGTFSSVEASFQNLFELFSYISTIIFARPDQFQWPSVISLAAVYMAGGLFMVYARRERGHLLHRPQCIGVKV